MRLHASYHPSLTLGSERVQKAAGHDGIQSVTCQRVATARLWLGGMFVRMSVR
jgi:hypothetical protein